MTDIVDCDWVTDGVVKPSRSDRHAHLMGMMIRVIDMHSNYKFIQGRLLARHFNMVHDHDVDLDSKII